MKEKMARLFGFCSFALALSGVCLVSLGVAEIYGLKEGYLPIDLVYGGIILYSGAVILAIFFNSVNRV